MSESVTRLGRVVQVDVRPCGAQRADHNEPQFELLAAVVHAVRGRPNWDPICAIVLPNEFFRLGAWLTAADDDVPSASLQDIISVARHALRRLARRSPGCRLLAGVQVVGASGTVRDDTFTWAFDEQGFAGTVADFDRGAISEWRPPHLSGGNAGPQPLARLRDNFDLAPTCARPLNATVRLVEPL